MNIKKLLINIIRPVNIPLTKAILKRHYQSEKELSGTRHAKKILILAPHMDDETIGPGGTIRKHADDGAEIHCVFITDGSSSVSELSKEELINVRMEEIRAVQDILGFTDVHYLGLPDGRVKSDEASQGKLLDIIEEVKPDLIYSTLFIDAHPDHTATAQLLSDTLKRLKPSDHTIRFYEINCTIPPEYINCVVDITGTLKSKKAAINEFKSQAIAFDGFLTLNFLKANLTKTKVKAAEGFLELTGDQVIDHHAKLDRLNYDYPQLFKQVNRTDTLLWAIFQNHKTKQKIFEQSLH